MTFPLLRPAPAISAATGAPLARIRPLRPVGTGSPARHARQLGAKAETFRRRASELDRQAHRAAAAEKRLVAEALETIESRLGA